jgi:hypothetical protein
MTAYDPLHRAWLRFKCYLVGHAWGGWVECHDHAHVRQCYRCLRIGKL